MIQKHQIEIGTAHTFQGDERDIMLISWAFADNSFTQSITFLQKANLFNVAITRGKNKVINFVSRDPAGLPDGHFRHYISFMQQYQDKLKLSMSDDFDENIYKNALEKEIATEIRALGHEVQAGVEIASLSADLVVDNKLIIEVDGVEDNVKSRMTNMKKQAILERCGFTVRRITYREWQYSKDACLERVLK